MEKKSPKTRGVIYQLSGRASAELLAVSLWSLRKHYGGPVTIFATIDCLDIAERMAADTRIQVSIGQTTLVPGCQYEHCVTKAITYSLSPYDSTIYMDADTIIQGDVAPLFDFSFAVARIGNLRLTDRRALPGHTRRQLRKWRRDGPIVSQLVADCFDSNPRLINAGVLAFETNHPALRQLHDLTLVGRRQWLADEMALLLIYPTIQDVTLLDDRYWNYSIKHTTGELTRRMLD